MRFIILAGAALTTLAASIAGANAQAPMQRVQVGVLECRGGASEPECSRNRHPSNLNASYASCLN